MKGSMLYFKNLGLLYQHYAGGFLIWVYGHHKEHSRRVVDSGVWGGLGGHGIGGDFQVGYRILN